MGASGKSEEYLRLAEGIRGSDVTVGLTRAQLQLANSQFEEAVAMLTTLRQSVPRHPVVLKFEASLPMVAQSETQRFSCCSVAANAGC